MVCLRRSAYILFFLAAWPILLTIHFFMGQTPVWIKSSDTHNVSLNSEHTQERRIAVLYKGQDANITGEFEYIESTSTSWVPNITSRLRDRGSGLPCMLSFLYREQLTAASRHFVNFVNLAVQWNMLAVEPLVKKSRLFGFHGLSMSWQQDPSYWYGRLFNLTLASKKLSDCLLGTTHHNASSSSIILPIHDFLLNSYRSITLVHFVYDKSLSTLKYDLDLRDAKNKMFQSKLNSDSNTSSTTKGKIADCTLEGKKTGVMKTVESLLNLEASRTANEYEADFAVNRMICVTCHGIVSLVDLKEVLFPSQIRNESVVFLPWQGPRTVYYKFKEEKMLWKCPLDLMPHSDEVFKASEQFIQSLSLEQPFLSVHMRTEKVLQHEPAHPGYLDCCTERLHSMINATVHRHKLKSVLVVKDYGTNYGTETCLYGKNWLPSEFCNNRSDTAIKRLGIPVAEFNPDAFHAPENAGFVSLVEADALLRGDVFITLGCGSFQDSIRKKFIHKYSHETDPKARCYSVCPCLHGIGWVNGLSIKPECPY